jgi:nucleotide-binding universal stress UspA family protein
MKLYHNILCPVDYSEHSISALNHALIISKKFDAKLVLLHVFVLPGSVGATGISDEEILLQKSRLEEFAGQYINQHPNLAFHVKMGRVGKDIIGTAVEHNADLIIMGSHGYSGIDRLLLGSTAEYVLSHCKIPALIIRL